MKDEEYDSMKDYEFSIMRHEDDPNIDDDYEPIIKHFQDD